MALPKEPRQKMINIMYLVLTAILALNVSAEVINAFKTVDKSLQNSTANISAANETIYKSLEDKLKDDKSAEQAKIWQPRAEQAKKYAADMNTYIETLKAELKKESDLKLDDNGSAKLDKYGNEDFKEDNLDASTRMFENAGKGQELADKLKKFRTDMLAISPEIAAEFDKTLAVENPDVKLRGQDGSMKDFTTAYFHMTPTIASLTLLSKFQNSVKNSENQVVTFAHSKIGEVKVRYDKFGVLVGQSSNYVMPGQEIVITAGIGAYSSAAQPKITINGAGVPTVDGQGTYKFQANGGGAHTVPVSITYKDQNGVDKVATSTISYTVGTPGGAAVMLDKMNVFYIGVENPVTIGSSTGWDRTTVSMSGGSISGSGSSRSVRVSSVGAASITVNADGRSTSFPFRVKKIPSPVLKVGSGRPRVPTVEFKNQQYVRAELENFDFDLRFNVVSATVYFSGAGFPSVATAALSGGNLGALNALMQRCSPGSSVTFDNVKVSGPDGTRSIDGMTVQLY